VTRFIVPFGFDGAADRVARAFALSLAAGSVPVENVPGAGGLSGVERANALAAAREATLMLATPTTHVLLPLRLGGEAAPSPAFTPLAGLGSAPNVLLVSTRLQVHDVRGLVERAKRERLTYASAGTGQTIHLCTALFCREAGVAMEHRAYDQGSAAAYAGIAAGRVHVYFDNVLACGEAIDSGLVVPLAVSAARRTARLPNVPTLVECGFPRHSLDIWFGVFGAHLDAAARREIDAARGDRALVSRLQACGLSGPVTSGAALAATIDASRAAWRMALEAAS
jgi:tripartite-type tricarboxylate transporter receptor subunit TctC